MENWGFWLAAGGAAAAVAATLIRASLRTHEDVKDAADFDIAVYRDQLSEIDRDIQRGTIAADEGARLKTEVSRRLLEADRAAQPGAKITGRKGAGWMTAGVITAVIAGSGLLYWRIGAVGYPDLPIAERLAMSDELRATRISQSEAEAKAPPESPRTDVDASFLDLMEKLRATTAERPDDRRGLELLARNEAALGNFKAAQAAQRHLVALKGGEATAEDQAVLAEMMILSAGGFVSPEAEAQIVEALKRDAENGLAQYYSGVMFAQVGRYDRAFTIWRNLLEASPEDAPWVPPLRAQLPDVAARAGINYELPGKPGLKGPTASDMQAAGEMSAGDRQSMIEGMVAQLGERLSTEGGSAEEWARLISSLGVLGRGDEAKTVYAEAKGKFDGKPAELATLAEAAARAGIAE